MTDDHAPNVWCQRCQFSGVSNKNKAGWSPLAAAAANLQANFFVSILFYSLISHWKDLVSAWLCTNTDWRGWRVPYPPTNSNWWSLVEFVWHHDFYKRVCDLCLLYPGETMAHLAVAARPVTDSLRETEERMLPILQALVSLWLWQS